MEGNCPNKQHKLLIPHGETKNENFILDVTPERAGWTYCGLKILELEAGKSKVLKFDEYELCILPLKGVNTKVTTEGKEYVLKGRMDLFKEVSDFIYIPLGVEFEISSESGGTYALPFSKCTKKFEVAYVAGENVRMEIRGAGQSSRQINNFFSPTAFANADKLCAVEVFTPAGNWSSYPPHKHDTESENEAKLEEIYYFLIDDPKGFAFMRTYTKDCDLDETETIRNGDLFLVPKGYHGPAVTPPGYHLYQLNVLAGPAEKRSMQFCDDPDYHWIRDSWNSEEKDKRLPMSLGGCPEQ
jgi:5-deoxy-glucuronate isomerase